jgi:hypothetical protein
MLPDFPSPREAEEVAGMRLGHSDCAENDGNPPEAIS